MLSLVKFYYSRVYFISLFLITIVSEISDILHGFYFTCTRKLTEQVTIFFFVDGDADVDCKESEELSSRYFTSA